MSYQERIDTRPPATSASTPSPLVGPFEETYSRRVNVISGIATAALVLGTFAFFVFPVFQSIVMGFGLAAVCIGGVMTLFLGVRLVVAGLMDGQ
jgi:hypothetical protein